MSKKYEREIKEVERLQQEVRDLKQENRQLRKRLKAVSKGYYDYLLETEDFVDNESNKEEVKKICWLCGIGEYKEIIVAGRRWRQCQNIKCGKRGKVSII
jgi:hypothetical protein